MFLRRHSRSTESRPLWSSCQVQSWDQRLSGAGEQHAVDVGEVNDVIFVNTSSIGFYPYLVLERERRRRRKRLSKWIATILAMPRVLRNLPLFRLTILVEGTVEPCRSPCVFVGNNEYRISGPGLGARERLDRGELCLYLARTQGRLSMFWLAWRCILRACQAAARSSHLQGRDCRYMRT